MSQTVTEQARPFLPKQKLALASSARFLLYGGGAGGGKTHWAIMDALGLNNPGNGLRAIDIPDYKGLFLRRTLPMLDEVIGETKKLYPHWGKGINGNAPIWYEQKKKWVFESGAQLLFGYVDRMDDVNNYQGHAYQWICFEELTQWPSASAFLYLHTRLRKKEDNPVILGMRATCNPGGVGHQWVRDFWQIDDVGSPTHFSVPFSIELDDGTEETVDLDRQFIPARLDENIYLSRAEYAAALEDPSISEELRSALREGRWDIVDVRGMIYGKQMESLHTRGHIRDVPYDQRYPVNTFWDIGVSDSIAIWFHQRIDGIDYMVDYYEVANTGLKTVWRDLQAKEYTWGNHFVPHDAAHRHHSSGGVISNVMDIMHGLGMRHIEIVPKTHLLWPAIEQTRGVLTRCFFDAIRCAEGLDCLTNYQTKVDDDGTQSLKPLRNKYTHGADAFRQFAQAYEMIDDALESLHEIDDDEDGEVLPWSRRAYTEEADERWIV